MRKMLELLAAIGVAVLTVPAAAAPVSGPVPAELSLERVFASPALSGPTPRAVKLSPDGRTATLLRPRATDRDRYDLWAVDVATGSQRMLVD